MSAPLPKELRLKYEAEAWSLRQKFWTQERIAAHLGVTQGAVSGMLARVERRTLARLQKRVERTKARQTAQLEVVASEAFDAWLHSKTPQVVERTSVESGGEDGDDRTVTTTESRTHHCDAALLAQARGALADIRAIWGVEAARKSEVSGSLKMYDVANPPDEL